MMMRKAILLTALLLLCAHGAFAQSDTLTAPLPETVFDTDIQMLDGSTFRLSELKGKISVVILWASWCAPCRMAVEDINQASQDYARRGIAVIVLTSEDPETSQKAVRRYRRLKKIAFPIGWANQELAKSMSGGRDSIPQILLINQQGLLFKRFIGYSPKGTMPSVNEALKKQEAEEAK